MPELHWLGDAEAKRESRRVPYRLLEPIEQVGDAAAQNLLIQGDNLDALKALPAKHVVFGEVGLAGEVRPVQRG